MKKDERERGGPDLLNVLTEDPFTGPERPCPDCDTPEQLVGPDNFWYACPVCHPETFRRKR